MIGILKARIKQGHRTMKYPAGPAPEMPERFVGMPVIKQGACGGDCQACQAVCPTNAIAVKDRTPRIDLGRCVFCKACQLACPAKAIEFSRDYRLAASKRGDLVVTAGHTAAACAPNSKVRRLFGRSLKLRQVSAGGCNACEADTNVLNTLAWDLGRFGIQFVASPRHADGLLVTGPVTANMELALRKTYDATPAPKIVIAVGACAISGGIYESNKETRKGVTDILPVDLFIPGCPPHPATILDGLLQLTGKIGGTSLKAEEEKKEFGLLRLE
jgi:Ni,Fe-hydrogenase III small subunit/ferredoxin